MVTQKSKVQGKVQLEESFVIINGYMNSGILFEATFQKSGLFIVSCQALISPVFGAA